MHNISFRFGKLYKKATTLNDGDVGKKTFAKLSLNWAMVICFFGTKL